MNAESTNAKRPAQAAKKIGIGLSTLWWRVKHDPDFPKPVKLSSRTTIFVESELDAYLQKRIAEARGAVSA